MFSCVLNALPVGHPSRVGIWFRSTFLVWFLGVFKYFGFPRINNPSVPKKQKLTSLVSVRLFGSIKLTLKFHPKHFR
jgi:hypothetical protein